MSVCFRMSCVLVRLRFCPYMCVCVGVLECVWVCWQVLHITPGNEITLKYSYHLSLPFLRSLSNFFLYSIYCCQTFTPFFCIFFLMYFNMIYDEANCTQSDLNSLRFLCFPLPDFHVTKAVRSPSFSRKWQINWVLQRTPLCFKWKYFPQTYSSSQLYFVYWRIS